MEKSVRNVLISQPLLSSRIVYAVVLCIVCLPPVLGFALLDLSDRIYVVRLISILSSASVVILTPHLLLPDRTFTLVQILSPDPQTLFWTRLKSWLPLVILFFPALIVTSFLDMGGFSDSVPIKVSTLVSSLLLVSGISLLSLGGFLSLGRISQEWQEKKRGDWYRYYKNNVNYGFAVPEGLVPSMLLTIRLLVLTVLTVLAGAWLGHVVSPWFATIPALFVTAAGLLRIRRTMIAFDVEFFRTQAYYSEAFGLTAGIRAEKGRELEYDSLYWIPRTWRPLAWIGLVQLDRRLPLGRLVASALILVAVTGLQNVPEWVVVGLIACVIIAKNSAIAMLARQEMTPIASFRLFEPKSKWVFARSFVNLRWTFPIFIGLLVSAVVTNQLNSLDALAWTFIDSVVAILCAYLVTNLQFSRYYRAYA